MFKIAIVEDEIVMTECVKKIVHESSLENHEYEIFSYTSGEEFLKEETLREYNLLILDIQLPGISGIELANLIFKQNISVPIIF